MLTYGSIERVNPIFLDANQESEFFLSNWSVSRLICPVDKEWPCKNSAELYFAKDGIKNEGCGLIDNFNRGEASAVGKELEQRHQLIAMVSSILLI